MGIRHALRYRRITTPSQTGSVTLRIEVLRLEVVLRDVHVARDGPQVEAEHLAPVLELHVGALAVDLPGELLRQHVRACNKHHFSFISLLTFCEYIFLRYELLYSGAGDNICCNMNPIEDEWFPRVG